jgi:hypothetical protein
MTGMRSLAQWVLDYRADLTDAGFPFEVPALALYDRCLQVGAALRAFLGDPPADTRGLCRDRLRRVARPSARRLRHTGRRQPITLHRRCTVGTDADRDGLPQQHRPAPDPNPGPDLADCRGGSGRLTDHASGTGILTAKPVRQPTCDAVVRGCSDWAQRASSARLIGVADCSILGH